MGEARAIEVWAIEDDAGVLRQYERVLPTLCAGVTVRCFRSAEEADAALRNLPPPHAVLLDDGLPGRSGLEWYASNHEDLSETRVLLVTGRLSPERCWRASVLGAGVLMKPIEPRYLEAFGRSLERDAAAREPVAGADDDRRTANAVRAFADECALSIRQTEILRLSVDGLAEKDIAARLCISLSTVKTHVHHLLRRARFKSMREVVSEILRRR